MSSQARAASSAVAIWDRHAGLSSLGDRPWRWTMAMMAEGPRIKHDSWLVLWNMNFIFPYIGNVIIPTDELSHFSEGWLNHQPGIAVEASEMAQYQDLEVDHRTQRAIFRIIDTMWAPPVINWFINPSNYSYKYHKP